MTKIAEATRRGRMMVAMLFVAAALHMSLWQR